MRRFHKSAAVAARADGFAVLLDGKAMRTPGRRSLILPSEALARAIAAEWQAQGDEFDPALLPLTQLAGTALDLIVPRRAEIVAGIANYAATDLLCYRAERPPDLVERQQRTWQPLLDWVALRHDAPLAVTAGVVPRTQPPASLAALAAAVGAYDAMALAALNLATTACGSLVLALALAEGRIDDAAAFALSQLDESYQIEHWGEDAEQMRRRAALREDVALAARFLALLRG